MHQFKVTLSNTQYTKVYIVHAPERDLAKRMALNHANLQPIVEERIFWQSIFDRFQRVPEPELAIYQIKSCTHLKECQTIPMVILNTFKRNRTVLQ